MLYILWVWTNVNDTYTSLCHHTEDFHCPRIPPCSVCSSYPLLSLTTTSLVIVSIVFPFPGRQILGIIQYYSLLGLFFSLSNMHLSSVQLLRGVRLFATPWTAARQASLSITNSWSLPKLMSIESVMPSNHLILCRPLLLPPSIFPSIRVFSHESVLHMRWPKYWSFSFSISSSSEYSGLISFRMDWLDCLAVQGTLKSLL